MSFNGGMFNVDALESTGSAVPDETIGDLGDVADARTKLEGDSSEGGEGDSKTEPTEEEKEAARLAKEEADKNKSPEELEAERKAAAEEAEKNKTPEQLAADKKAADDAEEKRKADEKAALRAEARKEFLKEMGVDTEEELKQKLAGPVKEPTEEEKAEQAEQYNAGLLSYATKNKLFNTDEFAQLTNIKKTPDVDLAYADFAAEYREINKDRKGEDGNPSPVTDEEAREAFNQLYHIDSEDASLKKIGEKQLKLVADQKRNQLESKFNSAKESFDDWNHKDKNSKPFMKFISDTVKTAIPESYKFEGPDGTEITYKPDASDIKELEKIFINNPAFEDYLENGASQSAKDNIGKAVETYLWYKNKDQIIKTVRDTSYEAGIKKGSVGAVAPFTKETKQVNEVAGDKELSTGDKDKLKNSFASPFGRV